MLRNNFHTTSSDDSPILQAGRDISQRQHENSFSHHANKKVRTRKYLTILISFVPTNKKNLSHDNQGRKRKSRRKK